MAVPNAPVAERPIRAHAAPAKVGGLTTPARVMTHLPATGPGAVRRQRQLLAAFCRLLLAAQFDDPPADGPPRHAGANGNGSAPARKNGHAAGANGHPAAAPPAGLSPRVAQTLERLLAGDSEKEAAARLGLSRHTVHVYVKTLYRHYDVSSRGELLARFVRPTDQTRPAE